MEAGSTAARLARDVLRAYQAHDEGDLASAAASLARVYAALFRDVSADECERAARAYFSALAIKDRIDEEPERTRRLTDPRWGAVYERFLETAEALRLDPRWAYHHHQGFQKHKGELNYWDDLVAAERLFVARVAGDDRWARKRSDGRNGPGPLPFLYMASAECHDLHSREAAELSLAVMTLYFAAILSGGAGPA